VHASCFTTLSLGHESSSRFLKGPEQNIQPIQRAKADERGIYVYIDTVVYCCICTYGTAGSGQGGLTVNAYAGQADKGKEPPSAAKTLESQAAAGTGSTTGSAGDRGAEALMAHLLTKAKFEGGPWDAQEASSGEKCLRKCAWDVYDTMLRYIVCILGIVGLGGLGSGSACAARIRPL
jgi:hypothetical protein